MKNKYISLLSVVVSMFVASSCSNYLDTLPDNRAELDNEKKILALLTSAYPSNTYSLYTSYMSDDYDDLGETFMIPFDRYVQDMWRWADDKEEQNDSPKRTWDAYYRAIANANQALKAIEDLGNPASMDAARGEAYMCRAFCHFKLVNLFCQHYTEEFGGSDMGIPYMEEPETEVNPDYSRGYVKDVYEKIDIDIQRALPLIDDNIYTVPKYHFNRLASYAFAAEFYLYYKDSEGKNLDKAIEYSSIVLGDDPESMMRDVSEFDRLPNVENLAPKFRNYVSPTRSTNLLLITNVSEAGLMGPFGYNERFVQSEYCATFEGLASPSILWPDRSGNPVIDRTGSSFYLRPSPFIVKGGQTKYVRFTVPYLFEINDPVALTGYAHSIQIAASGDRALLNRAEAYILKEDYASAVEDIRHWVNMRIVPERRPAAGADLENLIDSWYGGLPEYTSKVPYPNKKMDPGFTLTAKQKNFINCILQLRRIEFWGEGERWFDIKRYGITITRRIVIAPEEDGVTEVDVLLPRDKRRAIQLPIGVISAGMTANPR